MTTTTAGYGVDVWCGPGGLRTAKLARGAMLVAQAIYRRLVTPRGALPYIEGVVDTEDATAYGFDVSAYVGAVGYPTALSALPGQVRAEILKDDRVADVDVVATMATNDEGEVYLSLALEVLLLDASETFPLTFAVTDSRFDAIAGVLAA